MAGMGEVAGIYASINRDRDRDRDLSTEDPTFYSEASLSLSSETNRHQPETERALGQLLFCAKEKWPFIIRRIGDSDSDSDWQVLVQKLMQST